MPLNPLSPFTFYRRNKRRGLSILVTISLMILGIYVTVATLSTIESTVYANEGFFSKFSLVLPKTALSVSPVTITKIRSYPSVEEIIKDKGFYIKLYMIAGETYFNLFGVKEADMQKIIDLCNVRLKEGRLLKARTNELVLSEEIAKARGLKIGDKIGSPVNEMDWMPTEFVLVGILEGDIRLGFVSYEFLRKPYRRHSRPRDVRGCGQDNSPSGRGDSESGLSNPQRPGQALGWWEQGKYIVRSNREAMTSPPTRILAFGHEVVRALVQEFKESLRHDVRFYIHHLEGKPFSLAIVHAQASKGRALKLVCKRLGVPSQSVLAIGDDEADIDMFAVAAISVAVAEAPGEVLRAADFVGPSCEQGAVAWALRSFVL